MPKTRKKISALNQKKLLQEVDSQCPFCTERDVETFEFHHIDGDKSNNDVKNIIVVCSSCHSRIHRGIISEADVYTKKQEKYWSSKTKNKGKDSSINVTINSSSFKGDIAQNITKIYSKKSVSIPPHPPGSIGANSSMKGYIDYLIKRYFDYKKADKSYGLKSKFNHSVIHVNIQRKFGEKTFYLPEKKFENLVSYLQIKIDKTVLGRNNRSKNRHNYHSFKEHCRIYEL